MFYNLFLILAGVFAIAIGLKTYHIVDNYLTRQQLEQSIVDRQLERIIRHLNLATLDKQPTDQDRDRALKHMTEPIIRGILEEARLAKLDYKYVAKRLSVIKISGCNSSWTNISDGVRLSCDNWHYDFHNQHGSKIA